MQKISWFPRIDYEFLWIKQLNRVYRCFIEVISSINWYHPHYYNWFEVLFKYFSINSRIIFFTFKNSYGINYSVNFCESNILLISKWHEFKTRTATRLYNVCSVLHYVKLLNWEMFAWQTCRFESLFLLLYISKFFLENRLSVSFSCWLHVVLTKTHFTNSSLYYIKMLNMS